MAFAIGGFKPKNIPSYPTSITGCILHLKADAGVSFSSLSGAVSSWADQSGTGNNFTQAVVANQPLYFSGGAGGPNGYPYLAFSIAGATQMQSASPVSAQTSNWTQFIVVQVLNIGVGNQFIFSTGVANGFGFCSNVNTRCVLQTGVGEQSFGTGTANWEAWSNWDTSGVNKTCQVNGVAATSAANIAPSAGTTGSTLGSTGGSGLGSFTGNLSEVLLYNRTLAAGEILSVNSYFQSKYGL